MSTTVALWTIGHSNHDFERFVGLAQQERIEFLVDVRSYPYSRHAPQFNREELQQALRERGIGYLFAGDALGGRPQAAEHYDADGHAKYDEMARVPAFRAAIDRLIKGAANHRLAVMCSESDPSDCHRRLLVGKVLTERGAELRHIMRDGAVVVERNVEISPGDALTLFGDEAPQWRSTQSVSHKRRLSGSSTV